MPKAKRKNSQKNNNLNLLVYTVIVIAILSAVYLIQTGMNYVPKAAEPQYTPVYNTINTDSEFENAASELDTIDINRIDQGINENSRDTANF